MPPLGFRTDVPIIIIPIIGVEFTFANSFMLRFG